MSGASFRRGARGIGALSGIAALIAAAVPCAAAQEAGSALPKKPPAAIMDAAPAAGLLDVPVTNLFPGGVALSPDIENPAADDPESVQRGHRYFSQFNCSGCHAPNGGGGMGPALSNAKFIYGGRPADIYLSIRQGRPNGMPTWGRMLPDDVIWDLVTYIQSISKEPAGPWGKVTSASPVRPKIEQVPAEYLRTVTPWEHTTPFSAGQRPFEKRK